MTAKTQLPAFAAPLFDARRQLTRLATAAGHVLEWRADGAESRSGALVLDGKVVKDRVESCVVWGNTVYLWLLNDPSSWYWTLDLEGLDVSTYNPSTIKKVSYGSQSLLETAKIETKPLKL